MLSGSYPGELYWFPGLGDGKYADKKQIENLAGKSLQPGSASTVFLVDFDGDGRKDLVCGNIQGEVLIYLDTADEGKPRFGEATKLVVAGAEVKVPGGDSQPILVDWDGDDLADIVCGTGKGDVLFFRGLAEEGGARRFAEPRTLVAGRPELGDGPAHRSKVCVADFDADGDLDLLVGDFVSGGQARSLLGGPSAQSKQDKLARMRLLSLEILKLQMAIQAGGDTTKLMAELEAKKKERDGLMKAKEPEAAPAQPALHGYVWLYRRHGSPAVADRSDDLR